MTASKQHLRKFLKHNIAKKWEVKIKNVEATRERSRSAVIDSEANSSFWRDKNEHIKTGISF